MGSNRKNKGTQFNTSSPLAHRVKLTFPTGASGEVAVQTPVGNEDEWAEALRQVQMDALKMGWKEWFTFNLAVVSLAFVSISVGIAAGISISIYCWELHPDADEWPVALGLLSMLRYPSLAFSFLRWEHVDTYHYFRLDSHAKIHEVPTQRVTLTDPFVAISNSLTGHRDGLGRVLQSTTVPGLLHSAYQLVEEMPPLESPAADHALPLSFDLIRPPNMDFSQMARTLPRLCSDGKSVGYETWKLLKRAIQEANSFEAELFVRWTEYFALTDSSNLAFVNPSLYYVQAIVLPICPGAVLRAHHGPMFINAENLVLDCPTADCHIDARGSHFSFGSQARNVVIRGITFTAAHTSSLVFYHDGADVIMEDCRWIDNTAIHAKVGCVADVNSTSVVNFYRCHIGKAPHSQPGFISSLSIRQ